MLRPIKRWLNSLAMTAGFFVLAAATAYPAQAQNFTVNSTTDNPDGNIGDGACSTGVTLANMPGTLECTLRAAIQEANALPGTHVITVPAGTFLLTKPASCPASSGGVHLHYCISGSVSIVGAGASATILDAGNLDRVIFVSPGSIAQISGVTIQNGHQSGGTFDGGGGGGIMNQGALTLIDNVVKQNTSDAFGGGIHSIGSLTVRGTSFLNNSGGQNGGGIYQVGSQATIENTTFAGNIANNGGGLADTDSLINVTGSLFSGNTALDLGGGIAASQGPVPPFVHMFLTNTTLTGNQAAFGGALAFAGSIQVQLNNSTIVGNTPSAVYNSATLTLENTIMAKNPTLGANDCDAQLGVESIISNGHNLIGNAAHCTFSGDTTSNITGQDPQTVRLANNGGSTQTMALLATSPAIDHGDPGVPGTAGSSCTATDQRGVDRPQGSACDIGAYEANSQAEPVAIPDHGGNGGPSLVLIYGAGFGTASTVTLSCGGTPIQGSPVAADASGSLLGTTFNLKGVSPGLCDVIATRADGTGVTHAGGFTVQSATAPQLWAQIVGHGAIRVGLPSTFRILYGNSGNQDALAVALGLYFTSNVASNMTIQVTPPPTLPGDTAVDWSKVPITMASVRQGFNLIPLLLPDVPAGFASELEFTVNAPVAIHGQTFSMDVGIGPAISSADATLDPQFVTDMLAATKLYAQNVLGVTIPSTEDSTITAYFNSHVQSEITLGVNTLVQNLAAQTPVYSLGQLLVGGVGSGGAGGGGGGGGGDDDGPDCWIGWCDPAPPPPPKCNKWPPSSCGGGSGPGGPFTGSFDPNDKVGPVGFGAAHFVTDAAQLGYSVFFENLATATASAQKVVVTDQLDPSKVDLATFSLGPITFGDITMIPTPGLTQFTKDVDLRPAQNLIVRSTEKLDNTTGLLTLTFLSLDPATLEETQDPALGFLPPNTAPPEGEGGLTFTVKPKPGVTSGTSVCNQALVVFDVNPAINTPTWCNTVDTVAPVSAVAALPSTESQPTFTVTWSGTDADSGIATYAVFASDNGGDFTPWQVNVASTSAVFTGQTGHLYGFYSIATDNVGNTETPKTAADTTTAVSVGATAPVVTTQPINQTVNNGDSVRLTADANGTPSPTIQWEVSSDGGATFINVVGATTGTLTFAASTEQNGNQYRAVFTNVAGSATTSAALLTVNTPPSVTANPTNAVVTEGATATFTAAATGSPTPAVQWQVSTDGGTSFTNVAGATATSLTFAASLQQNASQYRAAFTNTAGSATTTAAQLTVNTNQQVRLAGRIEIRPDERNRRFLLLSLRNIGTAPVTDVTVISFGLTQTAGPECTPLVHATLPRIIGDLHPGRTATVRVAVRFKSCSPKARFTATFTYSGDKGAVSGTVVRSNISGGRDEEHEEKHEKEPRPRDGDWWP